jgi:hypothetical protein
MKETVYDAVARTTLDFGRYRPQASNAVQVFFRLADIARRPFFGGQFILLTLFRAGGARPETGGIFG